MGCAAQTGLSSAEIPFGRLGAGGARRANDAAGPVNEVSAMRPGR